MERSDSIINISKAMLAAQKNIECVIKDSTNPFFKSKYANLESVIEACKKHFNDAGIVVTQLVDFDTNGEFLSTLLIHAETGEFIGSRMTLPTLDDQQKRGSAVTYLKRYTLQALAFLPSEDDDGNLASNKITKPAEPKKVMPEDTTPSIAEEPITKTPFRRQPKTGGF